MCTKQTGEMFRLEDVKRQVAVVVVLAVIETLFLLTMNRIVSDVQIQPDLPRSSVLSLGNLN